MLNRSFQTSFLKTLLLLAFCFFCSSELVQGQNVISRFAGTGEDRISSLPAPTALPAPALDGHFDHPYGVTFDCAGNVYLTEQESSIIIKVAPNATMSALSGYSSAATVYDLREWPGSACGTDVDCQPYNTYQGDGGPAQPTPYNVNTAVRWGLPSGTVYDGVLDKLYIADTKRNRLRVIDHPGGGSPTVNYVTGSTDILIDGPIVEAGAGLNSFTVEPDCGEVMIGTGIATDAQGCIYIADNGHNKIIKLPAGGGIPATIAGTGSAGLSGDGGQATSATFNRPTGVAVDKDGNVYIADYFNNRIRKITLATGIITTIAGSNSAGFSGDGGAAASAQLNHPIALAVDDAYRVYVADLLNNRIRVINQANGTICTVAGDGQLCTDCPFLAHANDPDHNFNQNLGDGGNAVGAKLWFPTDVKVDAWGNLFITDQNHNEIRFVCQPQSSCTNAPEFTVSITADPGNTVCDGSSVTYTATAVFGGCSPAYQWKVNGNAVGSNSPTYTYIPQNGDIVKCEVTRQPISYYNHNSCAVTTTTTSNEIAMTVKPIPTGSMDITGPNVVCGQGTTYFQFTGTPGSTIFYHDPITNQDVHVHIPNVAAPGNYIVLPFTLPINNTQYPQYYTFTASSVSLNGCARDLTNTQTVTVMPANIYAEISGSISLCMGESGCIDVTGTPNSTVTYITGNAVTGSITLDNTGHGCIHIGMLNLAAAITVSYTLTGVSMGVCNGTVTGTVDVTYYPLPAATVALQQSNNIYCGQGCFTVVFTGTPNSTVVFYNPITAANQSLVIPASGTASVLLCSPVNNTDRPIYYEVSIVSITDNVTGCTNISSSTATVIVYPANIYASISGNVNMCPGEHNCIDITGTPNATVYYTLGNTNYIVTLDMFGHYCIPISEPFNLTSPYSTGCTLTAVSMGMCSGTVTGSVTITYNLGPTASMTIQNNPICTQGGCVNVTINGTPNSTAVFYNPVTGQNQNVNIPASGTTTFQLCPPANTTGRPVQYVCTLVSVTNNQTGCTTTIQSNANINVAPVISASISGNITLCQN